VPDRRLADGREPGDVLFVVFARTGLTDALAEGFAREDLTPDADLTAATGFLGAATFLAAVALEAALAALEARLTGAFKAAGAFLLLAAFVEALLARPADACLDDLGWGILLLLGLQTA
jgi:hypothetical protein